MTYRGQVKNGVIRLPANVKLAEGTEVSVRPLKAAPKRRKSGKKHPSLYERFKAFAGSVPGLPPDMARNHDHYIHGTPKR